MRALKKIRVKNMEGQTKRKIAGMNSNKAHVIVQPRPQGLLL